MDKKNESVKGIFKRSYLETFILYPLVLIFFISLIFIYNGSLYSSEKDKIIEKGELTALRSAEKFEDCLSAGKDSVEFVEYDFEKRIKAGMSGSEIKDYLVSETDTLLNSLFKNSTGFYAYVDGEYYEGADWVPAEDYQPTQRPWYKEIVANKGKVTIVDPYIDLDTGNLILTIGKTLEDGKNVLAVDISMEEIQQIAESDSSEDEIFREMVLDKSGNIVAHMDKDMLGVNLMEQKDTLESAIAHKIYNEHLDNFSIEFGDKSFSVYAIQVSGGWYSVSVIDDDVAFASLNRMPYIGLIFIVLAIGAIALIIISSEKRKDKVRKITAQLESAANIYLSLFDIDVKSGTFTPLKNTPNPNIRKSVQLSGGDSSKMFESFVAMLPDEKTREKMSGFIDLKDINERFKDINVDTIEYLSHMNTWTRGRLAVSERDHNGNITHVLWMIENIDHEKRSRDELMEKSNKLSKQLSSAADIYISLCELDIPNNDVSAIRNKNPAIAQLVLGCDHDMQERFFRIMRGLPESDTKQAAIDFCDLSDIDERMKDTNMITLEYISYGNIWVRARYAVSERDKNGRITHVLWMLEDIDKEKRARDELLAKADKLTTQLASAADIYISLCDLDIPNNDVTPIRNLNPVIAKIVNSCDRNMQELFFGIMRGLPESDTKQAAIDFCDLSDIDERMKDTNTVTLEYLSYGNIWVRARYVVSERDEQGRITHVLWMLENIDAEKKSRDKLMEMTVKLNKQVMSVADIYNIVYDFDIDNDILTMIKHNTVKATDIFAEGKGHARETLLTAVKSTTDSSSQDAMLEFADISTIKKRMTGTDTITQEYLSEDGKWRRARFVVSERDEMGRVTHVLGMVEDIDHEKKDREKLINMSERAIAANEAKSAFLSNMSHEIRTPINALLGMNEMVLRECDDKNIISYSENIRTAGTTLLGLINDILDFSKIEAGKMEILPVDYDLATMLKDLVNMIRTRAEAKDLQVLTSFDRDIPQHLKGDEVRIKQIITNILTNAVKYTEQGGITFSVGFEKIENDSSSIFLCVSVKDTGIGIKEEDMAKLFSKFERIEEKRNRNIEGTGLGMNITQSLLSLMDSHLEVESVYGQGSTFSFKIKQTVRKWDKLGNYEEAYKRSMSTRARYKESFTAPDAKVLVVDDMPMNILVFTSLLKQTGVQIDTAASGDEAIELASKNEYDVIFLDHMMPNKDGIETLKEMKADEKGINRKTPVICLTANAISGAREKYIESGFDDYLTKPIESEKLEEMLYEFLPHDKILRSAIIEQQAVETEDRLPDFLFGITEIDIVSGMKYCGTEKLYLEALKSYARSINRYMFNLKKYWIAGDVKNTMIMVHNIKSASRTIGAEWISHQALEVETAASVDDRRTMRESIEILMERCNRLGEQLSALTRN